MSQLAIEAIADRVLHHATSGYLSRQRADAYPGVPHLG
jgi:hypothetical protein